MLFKRQNKNEKNELEDYLENRLTELQNKYKKIAPKVEEAIEKSKDGILVLDEGIDWNESLLFDSKNEKAKEIIYVITSRSIGTYYDKAINTDRNSYTLRKRLPKEWWRKRKEEFQKITGVETALYCGPRGYTCEAKTKEGAIKLAKLAIVAPNEEID